MFGSSLLEFIISFALFFLIVSTLVSTVMEMISGLFQLRAWMLRKWIIGIDRVIGPDLFAHPLIQAFRVDNVPLKRGFLEVFYKPKSWTIPAYVDEQSFAMAFVEVVKRVANAADLPTASATLKPNHPKISELLNSLKGADDAATQANLVTWYKATMDRLSGSFKRRTTFLTLLLGFLLAWGLHADSIAAYQNLWTTAEKAQAPPADTTLQKKLDDASKKADADKKAADAALADAKKLPDDKAKAAAADQAAKTAADSQQAADLAKKAVDKAEADKKAEDKAKNPPEPDWLKWVGYALTAVAASLGSTFWFDFVNKFVNLRQVGKKPA